MRKEPELITVSSKGQVVIPQTIRHELGITQNTKLLAYGEKDTVVLKKIKMPRIETNLDKIFKRIDSRLKHKRITMAEVQKEIEAYRREKRNY